MLRGHDAAGRKTLAAARRLLKDLSPHTRSQAVSYLARQEIVFGFPEEAITTSKKTGRRDTRKRIGHEAAVCFARQGDLIKTPARMAGAGGSVHEIRR
ncbi:MAG: hypothetical protein AAFV53_27050 [Myxococcota bacterium]